MEGFNSLAIVNNVFINSSLSFSYYEIRSVEVNEKKVPSISAAQAFAKYVLPVPGAYMILFYFYSIQ